MPELTVEQIDEHLRRLCLELRRTQERKRERELRAQIDDWLEARLRAQRIVRPRA